MQGIDSEEIAKRYNALDVIVDEDDRWHQETENAISRFINKSVNRLANYDRMSILNAGSAGHSYGLIENHMLHVDVAERHLIGLQNAIVADITQLPLDDQHFDLIVCVGSVLNYCDPIRVFKEFTRVLKTPGYLILEFESSKTLNYSLKKATMIMQCSKKRFLTPMATQKRCGISQSDISERFYQAMVLLWLTLNAFIYLARLYIG